MGNMSSVQQPKWGRWLVLLVVGLWLTGCSWGAERPSSLSNQDTGIALGEPFTAFYQQVGGVALLGYPITEPFQPTESEPLLQYFQSIRLEYDGQQVQVTPLGQWAFETVPFGVEVYAPPATARVRTFSQTGYAVWDEFLAFYEANQGELLLGLPLSSQLGEGGTRVQYFENGRLEWRPERPLGQRVQLSPLGEAHFQAEMSLIYRGGLQNAGPVSASNLQRVHIVASVRAPILYAGDEQILYITIRRPDGRVVSDVNATVAIAYDDELAVYDMGESNAEGKIQVRLPLDDVPPGRPVLLTIRVYAPDGRQLGQETLGFRTWW